MILSACPRRLGTIESRLVPPPLSRIRQAGIPCALHERTTRSSGRNPPHQFTTAPGTRTILPFETCRTSSVERAKLFGRQSAVVARDRCCFSPYDATCDISSDRPPKVRNLFDDGFQVSLGSGYGAVIPISAARGRPLNSWFAGKSSQDELFSKRLDYPSGRTRPWPAERFSGWL